MKKSLLKVAAFSLLAAAVPVSFTSCKDYDDDITYLGDKNDELQKEFNNKLEEQASALQSQLESLKKAQAQYEADLKAANEAAKAAADAARQAAADAAAAQKAGDDAAAEAAKALQAAQTANAEAEAAKAAATQAKLDAVNEASALVETLKANVEKDIKELEDAFGEKYETLANLIGECASKEDVSANSAAIAELKEKLGKYMTADEVNSVLESYLEKINENARDITALQGKIQGIDASIETMSTDIATLKGNYTSVDGKVTTLEGNLGGVTEKLNNIAEEVIPGITDDIDALSAEVAANLQTFNSYKESVDEELDALKTFRSTYEDLLKGLGADLDDIKSRLDNAETDLGKVQEDLGSLTDKLFDSETGIITVLQGTVGQQSKTLDTIQTKIQNIQKDIIAINSNLSTLNAINSKRLTSVTLVPDAYVGGIPSIEFYTADYKPMGVLDQTTGIYADPAAMAAAIRVTNDFTKVFYRLNPAGVSLTDIKADEVAFVQQLATSRAAADNVVAVEKVEKNEEGQLVVFAKKNVAHSTNIDNAPNGKIYTVALQVPIAEKNYYTLGADENGNPIKEAAEDAVVYSEFSRIAETVFNPAIAAQKLNADNSVNHLWAKPAVYASVAGEDVLAEVPFNENTDLKTLVTACMHYTHNGVQKDILMDADQLKSFGFSFEFALAKGAYNLQGINQQLYAQVTKEGILTPINPAAQTSASRIGKEPAFSVVLKDSKNNVIAQKFFKVTYVTTMDALNIDAFNKPINCSSFSVDITWKQIQDNIFANLPFDMDEATFKANYTLAATVNGVAVDLNAKAPKQPIVWTLGLADMILNNGVASPKVTLNFTCTTPGLYPDFKFTLSGKFTEPATMPTIGKTMDAFWTNGVMVVYPQAMPQNYNGETATYSTNIFVGRPAPYINGLLDCATWDVQFNVAPAGYSLGSASIPVTAGDGGYQIHAGKNPGQGTVVATLGSNMDSHSPFTLSSDDNEDVMVMNFNISYVDNGDNSAAIAMVENELSVQLGWYVNLNGSQNTVYTVPNATTVLRIQKPLVSAAVEEVEPLTQNSQVQTRELADGLAVTDAFNNTFVDGSNYWKYYVIGEVKWGVGGNGLQITDGINTYSPASLNINALVDENTGVLTYTGSGVIQQKNLKLIVPVQISHKWGVLNTTVTVDIDKYVK